MVLPLRMLTISFEKKNYYYQHNLLLYSLYTGRVLSLYAEHQANNE